MAKQKYKWQCFGSSVRGERHRRKNMMNQDALHWSPVSGRDRYVVMALADGHTGQPYVRSSAGANLAVYEASNVMREFLREHAQEASEQFFRDWLTTKLPNQISMEWCREVAADLQEKPFSDDEMNAVSPDPDNLLMSSRRAYGTTLMLVATTKHYLIALQLGDGALLQVNAQGHCDYLIPPAEDELTSETDSMCMVDASQRFRYALIPLEQADDLPVLLLATSDGYYDSFPTEPEFLQVGSDYLQLLRHDGILDVSQQLDKWLLQTTHDGSGDDITVGVLYRLDDYYDHEALRR